MSMLNSMLVIVPVSVVLPSRNGCDYIAGMTDRFAQQEFERLA